MYEETRNVKMAREEMAMMVAHLLTGLEERDVGIVLAEAGRDTKVGVAELMLSWSASVAAS